MMATKEQERAALAKIKKIVEGLGKDSYIGTAFMGCFEIAEENIENDWAGSLYERAERYEEYSAELEEKLEEANETIKRFGELKERIKAEAKAEYDELKKEHFAEARRADNLEEERTEFAAKYIHEFNKAEKLERENINLKAKLYDMMMAQENA